MSIKATESLVTCKRHLTKPRYLRHELGGFVTKMQQIVGLAIVVLIGGASVAAILYLRQKWARNKRTRRRTRADLTGIVRDPRD